MLGHGVRGIFLTAPLSYAAVAFSLGQYEKRLRHGKLATSYTGDELILRTNLFRSIYHNV